ncbi:hypothetical protein [Flavobacterium sp. ZB4P13]|uniref:hypothetical protein n=1 Tax=Flavobacterium sp. ZB4P13 TaxID=3401728 RepID=UPI003AAE24BF
MFNQELKKYNLIQKDGNWEKFGITYKKAEKYFYLTAIPKLEQVFSNLFLHKEIPKGAYENFTHKDNLHNFTTIILKPNS